jgi:putative ABC transport system permease protein
MNDLRFALRMIASHRWFSAAVVAVLAIGIGINTTVFTLSGAVLFKPLPFRDSDRLVTLGTANPSAQIEKMGVSWPDFLDLRAQATTFEMIEAATTGTPAVLSEAGRMPERYRMGRVTGGFFRIFRIDAVAGRTFGPSDEVAGTSPVAVIGYDVWRNRYNLSPAVIGSSVRINEQATTIVGVMPQGFGMPELEDVWVPLTASAAGADDRADRLLSTYGLVKAGVSRTAAAAEVAAIAERLQSAYPATNKDVVGTLMSFHERYVGGKARIMFGLMLGAVALVLLIACANVANMMLSRVVGRQREMTIRTALGASRWRIVRQLLTESLLLSAAGGALGSLIAVFGVPAFDRAIVVAEKPSWIVFSFDWMVLTYIATICVISAVLFGLAPALRSSRVDLNDALKEGGRGGSARGGWLSATLVVLQFAFAVILITAEGLLIRSLVAGQQVNTWTPASEIMTGRIELPDSRYPDKDAKLRFYQTVQTRLAAVPGIRQVGVTSGLPSLGSGSGRYEVAGKLIAERRDRPSARTVFTSASYFSTVNLRIIQGRTFTDQDGRPGTEVAVVSRAFAAKNWPGEGTVGKQVRLNGEDSPDPWMTIVGVTDDIVQSAQSAEPDSVIFIPYQQADQSALTLMARTSGDPAALANVIRAEVQRIDRDLPLHKVQTASDLVHAERWPYRVFGTIFGVFAISALLMAAVGLYAVMSQATGRSTREIGIRMALGATPAIILRNVMRGGALQLGIGLVLGLGGAFVVTGSMRRLLFGVLPTDPTVFLSTSALLLTVGLLACWLPARRAAVISPVKALRTEDK